MFWNFWLGSDNPWMKALGMKKLIMNEPILHCDTATEGWVSNDFFRHSLDDSQATYFDIAVQPILEYRWIDSYSQQSCEHSSKLQLSIRFTPSRCLDVRQDWYPMYYPEGMKARVSPVQSIEPHRILAPTRDLNREPLGPQSRVVTTILPLHTAIISCSHSVCGKMPTDEDGQMGMQVLKILKNMQIKLKQIIYSVYKMQCSETFQTIN